MSSVQMKRRKRREKGNISIKSIICALLGVVGLFVLAAGIYSAVSGKPDRMITGASMLFYLISLAGMCFGIKYSRREGFAPGARFWGVLLPTMAFAGFTVLYIIGLLRG